MLRQSYKCWSQYGELIVAFKHKKFQLMLVKNIFQSPLQANFF